MAYVELEYAQEERILVEVLKEDYEETDNQALLSAIETVLAYHMTADEFDAWKGARG